jgi:hypothetical protein
VWQSIVDAIPTVEAWNQNVPRLVAENGPEFKAFAQAEAAKRGYIAMKEHGQWRYFQPWSIHATSREGVLGVGWKWPGYLAVVFAAKEGSHRYESVRADVPKEVADKLLNVPFPRKLYMQIVKGKYEMQRVVF